MIFGFMISFFIWFFSCRLMFDSPSQNKDFFWNWIIGLVVLCAGFAFLDP